MCLGPLAYGHATATKIFLGFGWLTDVNDRERPAPGRPRCERGSPGDSGREEDAEGEQQPLASAVGEPVGTSRPARPEHRRSAAATRHRLALGAGVAGEKAPGTTHMRAGGTDPTATPRHAATDVPRPPARPAFVGARRLTVASSRACLGGMRTTFGSRPVDRPRRHRIRSGYRRG
jgi:hypothetical protein